nr:endopeptidase La [Anaerolineae bacterium]
MLSSFAEFDNARTTEKAPDGTITLPAIPLRDMVVFPNMVTPLFIGRERSLNALRIAQQQGTNIICVMQRNPELEDPDPEDLHTTGVEVVLGRAMRMPDGTTSALIQGLRRVQIAEVIQDELAYRAKAVPVDENITITSAVEAHMRTVLMLFDDCVQLNRALPEDAYDYAANIEEPHWLADLVITTLNMSSASRQALLDIHDPLERLLKVSTLLKHEIEVLEIEDEIHNKIQQEVDKTQREIFLREQIRAIQSELGEGDIFQQEITEVLEKLDESALPEEVKDKALKEANRLATMPAMSPEVGIIRTYLDWLLELPWEAQTTDNLDVAHVAHILSQEHYGLEKAKDRILEHIAVRKLAADKMKTPILCFVGPPGTGKTSLGRSIAKALGRNFVRVSLGGVRDEAEIRGHRRTYIGAMPGRILQTMRRAGTINPLFMLDEVDKLGTDFRGDPSAALLEVLDPEQNYAFSDHYLEVDYDLSKVMFVTTANYTDPIPPALKDRLEIIDFPGYTEEEKLEIARQFLIPRELEAHGIADISLGFEKKALKAIIREYTYEAGVRNFEREIANICRKIARRVVEGSPYARRITASSIHKYLGPPRVPPPLVGDRPDVGIAYGIAWTEVGGDVLPVEVSIMAGKGTLTMTGQLGDVMQESAQAALSYLRSRADEYDVEPNVFEETDIHVHLPEGSIPKDGPSAGVTLVTALVSAFTNRPVRHDIVMTGEITLRGRVLPVGGVKEKILAAHRVNILNMIIPQENRKDLDELPEDIKSTLNITLVEHMADILDIVLLNPLPDEAEDNSD